MMHYDSNGKVHIRKRKDSTSFTKTGERNIMMCGATLPGSGMDINGLRLKDENKKDNICNKCLDQVCQRESTIPGFMKNGEIHESIRPNTYPEDP